MKRKHDPYTLDLFEQELPPAPVTTPGGLSCRVEIAHAMSDAMKGLDRDDVAARMSKLLGWKTVKRSVLDQYAAPSSDVHVPPIDVAIAFDIATESRALTEFCARKVGAKLVIGKEALDAKLGQLERLREDLNKQIKVIKKAMGEP